MAQRTWRHALDGTTEVAATVRADFGLYKPGAIKTTLAEQAVKGSLKALKKHVEG